MDEPAPPVILVIDDDAETRAMLVNVLEDAGYIAESAPNGAVALNLLRAEPARFGLVLLDLMMPLVDGWLFRRMQLADPTIAAIPVIALSAGTIARSHGLPQGLSRDNFLPKPSSIDVVLEAVARHFASPRSSGAEQPAPGSPRVPTRHRPAIDAHWVSTPHGLWVCVLGTYRGIVTPRNGTWSARVEDGGNMVPSEVMFATLGEAKAWVEQTIVGLMEAEAESSG